MKKQYGIAIVKNIIGFGLGPTYGEKSYILWISGRKSLVGPDHAPPSGGKPKKAKQTKLILENRRNSLDF